MTDHEPPPPREHEDFKADRPRRRPGEGRPSAGDLVAGAASHTCTLGALGALGTGVGATGAAAAMALGEMWLKVPESLRLNFTGQPGQYVGGKDLILHAISRLGVDGARYQVLEFGGEALAGLGMAGRFTMANMAIEAGAKTGIFPPDDTTAAYLKATGGSTARFFASDPDAEYAAVHTWDGTGMEPQVAVPLLPANGRAVSTLSDITIYQVTTGMRTTGNCAVIPRNWTLADEDVTVLARAWRSSSAAFPNSTLLADSFQLPFTRTRARAEYSPRSAVRS